MQISNDRPGNDGRRWVELHLLARLTSEYSLWTSAAISNTYVGSQSMPGCYNRHLFRNANYVGLDLTGWAYIETLFKKSAYDEK